MTIAKARVGEPDETPQGWQLIATAPIDGTWISAGPGLAEVDLAAIKALIQQRGQEGARHIASWTEHYGHREGPDPECEACADIFGEANRLRDLVAEIERLHSALRAATAPQDGQERVTTFTPLLWVSMSEEQRYEEYIRVRQLAARSLDNHHNALTCPYCNPDGLSFLVIPKVEDDEEEVPHPFRSRTHYEPGDDRDIWCADCEYHRDYKIHVPQVAQEGQP